ncbi:MAG: class I tRNA ligase family protein [bacterium]|nr:class I tRNA ligase family protein [bacterium]
MYNHQDIEKKWQARWVKDETYKAVDNSKKPKKYVLTEFPYPSGEGLHMGHLRPYTAGDVYARFNRMKGHETIYPIGWDAFGLPAENFALKKGVHPRVSTAKNIENAKKQLQSWGMSFDWSREVNTTDPEYYKWTQWLFLQFYKAGFAFEATGLINWCPSCKTGLANEEVINGVCERCGTKVEKKEMRQWYLKITAYAEKLLQGLKDLTEWPEAVKLQQENWIGKSEGAEIEFRITNHESRIKRFIILHGRNGSPDNYLFPWLKQSLEERGFEVEVPELPNTEEPKDEEQADFVQKNCTLDDQTAIVGVSFGGIVALRLLERGIKVNRVVLVSTPFSGEFLDKKPRLSVTEACRKGFDFKKIKAGARDFTLLYDTSDYVVPMSDGESFAKNLEVNLIKAKGNVPHFSAKEEPEVLTTILPCIRVFTTRPDTLFGATYMVLAPEHPLVSDIRNQITNINEVERYIEQAGKKTEIQRTAVEKDLPAGKAGKTGVELKGIKAINPATKEEIPVWIADYVLMGYGTGAIMAVPAHDERDFEFAKKYKLPIRQVIEPKVSVSEKIEVELVGDIESGKTWTGEGELINSDKYNGLDSEDAKIRITKDFGNSRVQYKLRDWVFSRQRYWGEPIPLIHCDKCGVMAVPEKDLPVILPEVEKYEPTGTGESPLAAIKEWVNVNCPNCEGSAKRETNTMPQWAGSSWYWLRYADPHNKKEFASKKLLKYWQPVDVYFGGMEHTTLHLLYSRFWNLFMYDQKLVTEKEPYIKRVPHGIVLAVDGEKMSKSRGNVVNPDEIVEKYGADTMRVYEMFLGPHDATVSWNDKGIMGVKRFLDKIWSFTPSHSPSPQGRGKPSNVHKLIKKITEDIETFKFNTTIAAFMEFLNKNNKLDKSNWETFLKLLAPLAPHITEELWEKLGHKESIHLQDWPKFNEKLLIDKTVIIIVQINGRVRGNIEIDAGTKETEVKEKARSLENVHKYLEGKDIVKEIFIQDKLFNFVIK